MMTVKIQPNDKNNPPGKLADAELHFTTFPADADEQNPLNGLKLIGFGIWERRMPGALASDATGNHSRERRNVTFPARQYSINGERRSFALLRPIDDLAAQDRIRELILAAYEEY